MDIDKWWKWVLAVLLGIVGVGAFVWLSFQLNDVFFGGDRRCRAVHCVIVK